MDVKAGNWLRVTEKSFVEKEGRINLIQFNVIENRLYAYSVRIRDSPFRSPFHDIDDPVNDKFDFILLRSVYETPETTSFARRN
jgi:hypothetical protein